MGCDVIRGNPFDRTGLGVYPNPRTTRSMARCRGEAAFAHCAFEVLQAEARSF